MMPEDTIETLCLDLAARTLSRVKLSDERFALYQRRLAGRLREICEDWIILIERQ
jgi:hypothetical protein